MEETKAGSRHSAKDRKDMQDLHDIAVRQGAACSPPKSIGDDAIVHFGDAVKATTLENGDVKLAGYLVRFGDATKTDLTGDYFTKNTDFGTAEMSDGWFNHRMPVSYKGKRVVYDEQLPDVKLTKDDIGVFAEIIIGARNEYEKTIADLGIKGKLGWSSGTAPHLVDRKQVGNANEITRWRLGLDASLTPTPAEARNSVMPIKSLITEEAVITDTSEKEEVKNKQENKMELKEEIKAMFDEQATSIKELVKTEANTAAAKAVEDVLDKLPEVKAKLGAVEVTHDEADNEFKSIAEQMQAVKAYTVNGRFDPRLKRIQALETKAALGSNESVPSQGGFLLEPTLVAEFLKPIHEDGPFSSRARKMPVGNQSNYGWINGIDETSRATGSRWGGVRGYWLAEADSKTASQPKFRRINWELHKLAVLQYATDELLADASQMNAVIRQSSAEELNFLVNDAIFRGTGAGQPKGLLLGGALQSAVRTNANNIDHDDILRMINLLSPTSYANSVWFASPDVQPEIDSLNFTAGTTGILSPYVSYTENGVTMLRGRPVVYNEFSPTLGTLGDIVLADMSDYLMWEKAVEAASSIHVQFVADQTVFRFVYRVDGTPATYVGLTPFQGSTLRSPYVALAATT